MSGPGTLEFIDAFIGHCARTGFTPSQAAAWADELTALASPWHVPSEHENPSWLAWHRHFSRRIRAANTPSLWSAYREAWGAPLSHRLFVEAGRQISDEQAFAKDVWPYLALHEDSGGWHRRRSGVWGEPDVHTWGALASRLGSRKVIPGLVRMASTPCEWPAAWKETGLRAVRWGWVDACDSALLDRLPGTLVAIQESLARPLGWEGPVLGLAKSTALVLATGDSFHGCGRVSRDPDGEGQSLAVDDWSVLAHEWLHTLDILLARDSGGKRGWATLNLVEDEPAVPEDLAHASALDAWWVQVIRIQMSPLPDEVAKEANAELAGWEERWSSALDKIPGTAARILDEQGHASRAGWTEAGSASRWRLWLDEWLPDAPSSLRDRLARTAAAEIAWGRPGHVPGDDRPLWASFLSTAVPDAPGVPGLSRTDTAAYLAHPVEIMARSFEVAFSHPGDPVWGVPRSLAGMVWPLPAELRHQREGWLKCLSEIQPWWEAFWQARQPRPRAHASRPS